jgi:hypothetical protein
MTQRPTPDVMQEDLSDVTMEDMVAEVKRELNIRLYVYPKRVATHYMTQVEAARYTRRMRAVLKALMLAQEEARDAGLLL